MTDLLGRPLGEPFGLNLFTPDFGLPPHRIVGREQVLGSIQDGLGAGPGDPRFTSVIIGHRGSGKTVLLNEIEDVAAQAGWTVLKTDATPPGLHERIDEEIRESANSAALGLGSGTADADTELRQSAGVASVSRRSSRKRPQDRSIKRKLEILGAHAAENDSAVLLSVDELQAGKREELRRLSADLQHITKRNGLPVAFIGSGLPSIEFTLMRDNKMTFFQRCHDHTLEPLAETSVLSFFKQTIQDAGGDCPVASLQRMAQASQGFPYKMQLIGDSAWVISGAPANEIDADSVELAIAASESRMKARVYSHIWESLAPLDQEILRVVASRGGAISRRELGAALSATSSHVVNRLHRLTSMGCIVRVPGADIELGLLAPRDFVSEIVEEEASLGSTSAPASGNAAPR